MATSAEVLDVARASCTVASSHRHGSLYRALAPVRVIHQKTPLHIVPVRELAPQKTLYLPFFAAFAAFLCSAFDIARFFSLRTIFATASILSARSQGKGRVDLSRGHTNEE